MEIGDIQAYLQPQMQQVEALIEASLRSDVGLLDATNRRIREHPGKMIRPALSLLAAGAAGKPCEDSLRYAAAVELLHNATLLHDDVVDAAAERRGLPTVFQCLGGGPAVLLGDFWLVKCIRLVLSAPGVTLSVIDCFAKTLQHLAEGELLQMEKASSGDTTQEDYLRIVYGKTASLFELSARVAALSVQAPDEWVQALSAFARHLGLAFQIKDDIFDYGDPADGLGKPVGIDLKEQKITQPLLCALAGAGPAEESRIRRLVADAAAHPEHVDEIRSFVRRQGGVEAAVEKMEEELRAAADCLRILPDSQEKACLTALVRYTCDRKR